MRRAKTIYFCYDNGCGVCLFVYCLFSLFVYPGVFVECLNTGYSFSDCGNIHDINIHDIFVYCSFYIC